MGDWNAVEGFIGAVARRPRSPALEIDDSALSYGELAGVAQGIADGVRQAAGDAPLCALLAARSVTAYAGLLGILLAGKGYVPLDPRSPVERLRAMLALAECTTLVCGRESLGVLEELLSRAERELRVLLPQGALPAGWAERYPQHRFAELGPVPFQADRAAAPGSDAAAYVLFTSGTAGGPKGVRISHRNLCAYVETAFAALEPTAQARFAQHPELTFDLSKHEIFLAWRAGACLCPVPAGAAMLPARFIVQRQISHWTSVPSVVALLSRTRLLAPGAFPSIRCSVFAGEPLSDRLAREWEKACPYGVIENFYGLTETSVAVTRYRWDAARTPAQMRNGIVPIGPVFATQRYAVADPQGRPAPAGEPGELCLQGDQIATGYLGAPEETARRWQELPACGAGIWFRTGDWVVEGADGCLSYLGRMDQQIKVRGFRVELQELEFVLRAAAGTEEVVAVAWPISDAGAEGLVAVFPRDAALDRRKILAACRRALPEYMVPSELYVADELPLNANGKIDRGQVKRRLEEAEAQRAKIEAFILSSYRVRLEDLGLEEREAAQVDWLDAGVVNSLEFLSLLQRLERQFGVRLELAQVDIAQIARLSGIAGLVSQALPGGLAVL